MWLFYYMLKRIFLNLKRLSDASVASLTEKEYGSAVHFFMDLNVMVSANIWWTISAICVSSLLFWIFVIKKWVVFSLISFGTLKYDCVFNFLPLINNLITNEFSYLLLIISAIISSKTINILRSLSILYSSIFL